MIVMVFPCTPTCFEKYRKPLHDEGCNERKRDNDQSDCQYEIKFRSHIEEHDDRKETDQQYYHLDDGFLQCRAVYFIKFRIDCDAVELTSGQENLDQSDGD